jgi:hypothetical protein
MLRARRVRRQRGARHLTDGDGLVKITGDYAAEKYAKLLPYVGRQVEVTGAPIDTRLLAGHQRDEARADRSEEIVQILKS